MQVDARCIYATGVLFSVHAKEDRPPDRRRCAAVRARGLGEYVRRVEALRSRNALLTLLESAREQQGMTKRALADRAGLDASSVRRLLTSATANPTTDNAFRLMAAMGITLEAKLPTGERVSLVSPGSKVLTARSTAAI